MIPIKRMLAATACACAMYALHSVAASAQYATGPYVSLGAGVNFPQDADTSGAGVDTDYIFNVGPAVVGAIGYGLGHGFRVEGEINYRSNDVEKASTGIASGNFNSWAFMVNGLYDVMLGWPVTPFVGGGVGAAAVSWKATVPGSAVSFDKTDSRLALQAIGGVSYALTDQLKLDASYRYFQTTDPVQNISTGKVASQYRNNTILLALRWEFDAPARP